MIFPVSTLFLAALLFNAALTFGAPLRYSDTRSVRPAPATVNAVSESDTTFASHEQDKTGESQPLVRRYPRKIYYERHEPQPETTNEPVSHEQDNPEAREDSEPPVKRYPRGIYHAFYEKREPEPAITVNESTVVISKVTIYDSPADGAAHPNGADSVTSTLFSSGFTTTLTPTYPSGTPSSLSVTPTTTPVSSVTPVVSTTVTPTPLLSTSSPVFSSTPTSTSTDGSSLSPVPTSTSKSSAVPPAPTSTTDSSVPASSTSSGTPTSTGSSSLPTSSGVSANNFPVGASSSACSGCSAPTPVSGPVASPRVVSPLPDASNMPPNSNPGPGNALPGRDVLLTLRGRQVASSGAAFATALRRRDLTK